MTGEKQGPTRVTERVAQIEVVEAKRRVQQLESRRAIGVTEIQDEHPCDEVECCPLLGDRAELAARLDEQRAKLREQQRSKKRSNIKQKDFLSYAQGVLLDLQNIQRANAEKQRELQRCEQLVQKQNEASVQRQQRRRMERRLLTRAEEEHEARVQTASNARRLQQQRIAEAKDRTQDHKVETSCRMRQIKSEKLLQKQQRASSEGLRRSQSAIQRRQERSAVQEACERVRQQKAMNRDQQLQDMASRHGKSIKKTIDRITDLEEQKRCLLQQIESWEERKEALRSSLETGVESVVSETALHRSFESSFESQSPAGDSELRLDLPGRRSPRLGISTSWQGNISPPRSMSTPRNQVPLRVKEWQLGLRVGSKGLSTSSLASVLTDSTAPSTSWNSELGSFVGSPGQLSSDALR